MLKFRPIEIHKNLTLVRCFMAVLPPSKSDFLGNDSHSKQQSTEEVKSHSSLFHGRSFHLQHKKSASEYLPQHSEDQKISSREYFIPKKNVAKEWVEEVLQNFSLRELVGQLLFCQLTDEALDIVTSFPFGGVNLLEPHSEKQQTLLKALQAESPIPLIVTENLSDWEDSFALKGSPLEEGFYLQGKKLAESCHQKGTDLILLPLEFNVQDKRSWLFIKGLQDNGVGVALTIDQEHCQKENISHLPLFGHFVSQVSPQDKIFVNMVFESGVNYIVCREKQGNVSSSKGGQGVTLCELTESLCPQDLLSALLSGVDGFVIDPTLLPKIHHDMIELVHEGKLSVDALYSKVTKLLYAKEWAGIREKHQTMLFATL